MEGKLKVTLVKSPIGSTKRQKANLESLGCTKMHKTVVVANNVYVQGMIKKVAHLVQVEEI